MTEYAKDLAKAFGYLSVQEVEALQKLSAMLPKKAVVANVGIGTGTSSLTIKEARPDVTIYSIDKSTGGPFGGLENEVNAFRNTGLDLPVQILGDSAEVGKKWDKGLLDMIFIDAGHLLPEVTADINAWTKNLKDGGLLVFHDYHSTIWPDVTTAVDALVGEQKPVIESDHLVAFRQHVVVEKPKEKVLTKAPSKRAAKK